MAVETIYPKRNMTEQPLAKTDDHHEALAADPAIKSFPQGSTPVAAPAVPNNYSAQQDQSKVIQSSGGAMQEGADVLVKTDDKFGNFINSKWRPLMAVIYMVTCACDFVVFPVLWSLLQSLSHGQVTSQWMPLTLQGAGLYHIAMGAVLGIAAYGRSQEKIAGKA